MDYNKLFDSYSKGLDAELIQEAIETICQQLELKSENDLYNRSRTLVIPLMALAFSKLKDKSIGAVYSEFEKSHPSLKISDYRPIDNYKLQLWLEDGSVMHYDYLRELLYEAEDSYLK